MHRGRRGCPLAAAGEARRGRAAQRRRRPDRQRARRRGALSGATPSWSTSAPRPRSTASPPTAASSAASSCRASAPPRISSPAAPPSCRRPSSRAPPRVIGRRTEECIQAGVLYGTADAVDGIVRRIRPSGRGGTAPVGSSPPAAWPGGGAPLHDDRAGRPAPHPPGPSARGRTLGLSLVSAFARRRLPPARRSASTTCSTCAPPSGRSWRPTPRSATSWRSGSPAPRAAMLGPGAARPGALGRLPQRRHARAQQRVRPGRG